MKYFIEEKTLYGEDGAILKKLDCPLSKEWDMLAPLWHVSEKNGFLAPPISANNFLLGPDIVRQSLLDDDPPFEARRWCCGCDKAVINIGSYTEAQIRVLVEHEPDVCIYCPLDHQEVKWVGASINSGEACQTDNELVRIRTLRQPQAIRDALQQGKRLLVQLPFRGSALAEDRSTTPRIVRTLDELLAIDGSLTGTFQNQNKGDGIGAYIIPDSLQPGTKVILLDALEWISKSELMTGSSRHSGALATWTGVGFDIDIKRLGPMIVG